MSGLFISYRRGDQAGYAGRLADALESTFGADNVFRDIEDIRPGDDFVTALEQQLQSIDMMLVVIGPAWLSASRNGVRRLDEADDFVRREIQAGLDSGKPLLPVLVSGATMPTADELPVTIAALARRQAFVLSDPGWSSDVARLTESISTFLPLRRRISRRRAMLWGVAGIGVVALLAASLNAYWPAPQTRLESPPTAESAGSLSGRWMAQVNYDWGAAHQETFDLRLENGEVQGTATYLRVPRSIEQGQFQAGQVSFVTHSQEILGDSPALTVTHRYRGVLKAGELHLQLASSGGQSLHTPVEFIARRGEKQAR